MTSASRSTSRLSSSTMITHVAPSFTQELSTAMRWTKHWHSRSRLKTCRLCRDLVSKSIIWSPKTWKSPLQAQQLTYLIGIKDWDKARGTSNFTRVSHLTLHFSRRPKDWHSTKLLSIWTTFSFWCRSGAKIRLPNLAGSISLASRQSQRNSSHSTWSNLRTILKPISKWLFQILACLCSMKIRCTST